MKYTLEELQELYGRQEDDVSKNAQPLVVDKLAGKWKPIMEDAIRFVNESFRKDPTPLSVRQTHYHLVHAGLGYDNDLKHSKKLTKYMLQARIANLIQWRMISEEESTVRHVVPAGMDPEEAIRNAIENAENSAGKDPWDEMGKYLLIVTEKRELGPQLEAITDEYYARLVCTRGYGMWSRYYKESRYLKGALDEGKECTVLFITDADPSGLDMNRFGASLIRKFWGLDVRDVRCMLTEDQIQHFNLPPAPAKVTDPRAKWYINRFGDDVWEVDALGKERMQEMLRETIESYIDHDVWDPVMEENRENILKTRELADKYLKEM